jgi:hypothetical protein
MMSDSSVLPDRSRITTFTLGLLLGLLLAFGTSFVFFLIIFGPLVGLSLAIAGFSGGLEGRSRANIGSGMLIGTGGVYLLEAVNSFNSCHGPNDVCGDTSALMFVGFAVVVLTVGLLLEGITVARAR